MFANQFQTLVFGSLSILPQKNGTLTSKLVLLIGLLDCTLQCLYFIMMHYDSPTLVSIIMKAHVFGFDSAFDSAATLLIPGCHSLVAVFIYLSHENLVLS